MESNHNLDIKTYSLDELLDLFHLDYNMTEADLSRAKKQVLYLHPDKSKLPAEYFLFYKQAFVKIVELYEDLQKHNRPITKESTIYNSNVVQSKYDNRTELQKLDEKTKQYISSKEFNREFNELFEKNMKTVVSPSVASKNSWFSSEDPEYKYEKPATREHMNATIETIRQTAAKNALIKGGKADAYIGNFTIGAQNLYEEDDVESTTYISAPLFQGKKGVIFDDIRKVHKDETIIPVKYEGAPNRTMTVDEYINQRTTNANNDLPMAREEAERILAENSQKQRQEILAKQYRAGLRADENAIKSQKAMAHLFRLENGADSRKIR